MTGFYTTLFCPKCKEALYSPSYRDSVCQCKDENGDFTREQVMRYLQVVVNSMTKVKRMFIPMPDGEQPYLERFHMKIHEDGSKDYLHVIYESDGDRDPHDHPFDFSSTILSGSYSETGYHFSCPRTNCQLDSVQDYEGECDCGAQLCLVEKVPVIYRPNSVNSKRAAQLHRLTILEGPVFTFVRRGPKLREWGFQTPNGWLGHREYIRAKWPNAATTEID